MVATLWLLISIAWTRRGGAGQLLWLCDVATLGTAVGLLLRSPLILTAQLSGMLAYHTGWQIDFLSYAFTGRLPLSATSYMFGNSINTYEKALSFFQHTFLVPICVWGLRRTGVSRSGWMFQSVQTLVVLGLTALLTSPAENVNWLFGAGFTTFSPAARPPAVYYLLLVFLPPLLVYAPINLIASAAIRNTPLEPTAARAGATRALSFAIAGAASSLLIGFACEPASGFPIEHIEAPSLAQAIAVDIEDLRMTSI